MPLEVVNEELYHDRTVQDWHRATFPEDCWAIDLDLMGACSTCREPLYLIEASTYGEKPTTILKALARKAQLPAFLVVHAEGQIAATFQLFPARRPIGNAKQFAGALTDIRTRHAERDHTA